MCYQPYGEMADNDTTHGSCPIGLMSNWARFYLGSFLIAVFPNSSPHLKPQVVKLPPGDHVGAELGTSRVRRHLLLALNVLSLSIYLSIYPSTYLLISLSLSIHIYIYIYIYMNILCVCVYIYVYIHTYA